MIEELIEPIWEHQKGETPNQYKWFNKFLQYESFDLIKFHTELTLSQQNNEKKIKLPTLGTIRKWSSNNKWTIRKECSVIFDETNIQHELKKLDLSNAIEEFYLKNEIKIKRLENLKSKVDNDEITGYQFNQDIQGITKLDENIRLSLGKATERIDANANIETNNLKGLADALKE